MMKSVIDQYLTQSAGPAMPPSVTPDRDRWRLIAVAVISVVIGVLMWWFMGRPVTAQPVTLTYGGVERTINAHALTGKRAWIGVHMVHPSSRETYTVHCAACHDPFGGRVIMPPRGR